MVTLKLYICCEIKTNHLMQKVGRYLGVFQRNFTWFMTSMFVS